MINRYGRAHRLAVVLGIFLSCYLVPNMGQHGLECGWGHMLQRMLDRPVTRFRWGECMLAQMYHEMHEVVYQSAKTIAAGVLVL